MPVRSLKDAAVSLIVTLCEAFGAVSKCWIIHVARNAKLAKRILANCAFHWHFAYLVAHVAAEDLSKGP